VKAGTGVKYPKHGNNLHHEVELVIRIGKAGQPSSPEESLDFVDAFTIGLDLTLRDVQNRLKEKGLPWEISKAFDQSAPIGAFIKYEHSGQLNNLIFRCFVDGEKRQEGNSNDMIFSVKQLIFEISRIWILQPGDLIFTGTPSGVGTVNIGNTVSIENEMIGSFSWKIVE
jgi:2-keto-4-pentenoate hydratase/2-oxohepta-3-ene-1,7-dioic acid hydratase in catechol pathway